MDPPARSEHAAPLRRRSAQHSPGLRPSVHAWVMITALGLGIVALACTTSRSNAPDQAGTGVDGSAALSILWDVGAVRLSAFDIRISVGGQSITRPGRDVRLQSRPGASDLRELRVSWIDRGDEFELRVVMQSDGSTWWIRSVRHSDLRSNGWIDYQVPLLKAPLGAVLRTNLRLTSTGGDASLEVDDLELLAFVTGALPVHMESCVRAADPDSIGELEPTAYGQPLTGTGIEAMSPGDAGSLLMKLGLCHTFRRIYNYVDDPSTGYSETWCTPPSGEIIGVTYAGDGSIIILVLDPQLQTPRPQPAVGWGCSVASPSTDNHQAARQRNGR